MGDGGARLVAQFVDLHYGNGNKISNGGAGALIASCELTDIGTLIAALQSGTEPSLLCFKGMAKLWWVSLLSFFFFFFFFFFLPCANATTRPQARDHFAPATRSKPGTAACAVGVQADRRRGGDRDSQQAGCGAAIG